MGTQRRTGRRTKLTPALQAKVVDLLKAGLYAEQVCDVAGISEATYYAWQARGRKALEAAETASDDETLDGYTVKQLRDLATERGIPVPRRATKADLVETITDALIDPAELPYVEFLEAVKKASGDAELRALLEIQKAGKQSWQAYAWFLERRHKERWAKEKAATETVAVSDVTNWLHHLKGGQ